MSHHHPIAGPSGALLRLVEAALAGGREVMAVYRTEFEVGRKADGSLVCAADTRAEAAIAPLLARAFPGAPVIAEEAAAEGRAPAGGPRFLLVDPLDGTREFAGRNGEFTVNVALVEGGLPVAGVVLAPASGDIYAGADGAAFQGALSPDGAAVLAWRPIRTRPAPAAPVAVASRSHSNAETEAMLARLGAGERRSIGSSLKFCLVAAGEADFYPRLGPTMEWDTAAGHALLAAAGGAVADLAGAPLRYGVDRPGMRRFENPHFLAVGDEALLARLIRQPAA